MEVMLSAFYCYPHLAWCCHLHHVASDPANRHSRRQIYLFYCCPSCWKQMFDMHALCTMRRPINVQRAIYKPEKLSGVVCALSIEEVIHQFYRFHQDYLYQINVGYITRKWICRHSKVDFDIDICTNGTIRMIPPGTTMKYIYLIAFNTLRPGQYGRYFRDDVFVWNLHAFQWKWRLV